MKALMFALASALACSGCTAPADEEAQKQVRANALAIAAKAQRTAAENEQAMEQEKREAQESGREDE